MVDRSSIGEACSARRNVDPNFDNLWRTPPKTVALTFQVNKAAMASTPTTTMENKVEVLTNGTRSLHTPSPSINGFSLTEYTANPSPPREGKAGKGLSSVPPDFRLADGNPDVW
jgi:hypothetical protein